MTRFLLGALDDAEKERVLDRLAAEPSYFEEMAATEDDLLMRWHRQQLSSEDRALFAERYLSSPARRVRVDETLALLEAAEAWKERKETRSWSEVLRWLMAPSDVPRFAFAALLVGIVSLAAFASRNVLFEPGTAERGAPQSDRPVIFHTTLSAAGERGPAGAQGMDRLTLPPGTVEIHTSFEIQSPSADERFEADLEALDGGAVAQPSTPLVQPATTGATVTVSMTPPPDGDYVLRLRRVAGGNPEVVATHAFRVTRSRSTTAR